jgi:hypothetical protein
MPCLAGLRQRQVVRRQVPLAPCIEDDGQAHAVFYTTSS